MGFLKKIFYKKKIKMEIINFEKLFVYMGMFAKEQGEKKQVIYQVDYIDEGKYKRHRTRFNGCYIAITSYGYIERFRVPYTFDKEDIEGFKSKLELQTNKSLDIEIISSSKGAYFDIKVYHHKLKEKYDFELIEPTKKDKLQVTIGYGRLGLLDFKIDKHLGVFGQSGSGKSTLLKVIITQLVLNYRPYELQLYLSDNKGGTELNIYSNLEHCQAFVKDINGLKKIFQTLTEEAERRYKIVFNAKVEDIQSYNLKFKKKKLSTILFVIEEFITVYKDKTIQSMLQIALSQWRSVNIFIIITTQYPSAKVLTSELKCNLATIIGLKTLDSNNSNVIIDKYNLLNGLRGDGHGYLKYNGKIQEFQSFYIDHEEVKKRIRNVERKKEGLKEKVTNNNSEVGEVKSLDFLDSI